MSDEEYPNANSALGERLLAGVQNLWRRVISLEGTTTETRKIVDQQGLDLVALRREMEELRSELHGLKVSRGRARAKNMRLERQLAEAERLLSETQDRLH